MSMATDSYSLLRDADASSRLSGQHYLWKDALGFALHPDIALPRGARIADVATGNGIWLLDIARNNPGLKAHYHGFDISLDQCPSPHALPSNFKFHTWNCFEEPPAELVGTFDVVHIRLITFVIRDNDPLPVMKNVCKLLKPGGCIQWDEVDNMAAELGDGAVGKNPSLFKCLDQLSGFTPIPGVPPRADGWKTNLVERMNNTGYLSKARLHRYGYDVLSARLWTDLYLSTWREYAQKVIRKPDETEALALAAMKEARAGATIRVPMLVWVAQKPREANGAQTSLIEDWMDKLRDRQMWALAIVSLAMLKLCWR